MPSNADNARNYSSCDSLLLGSDCGAHTFPYMDIMPFSVVSRSGRPAIESYVTGNDWKSAKLIELLYCVQGCHRGDGVR